MSVFSFWMSFIFSCLSHCLGLSNTVLDRNHGLNSLALFLTRKTLLIFHISCNAKYVGGGWRAISNASIKVSSWLLKGNV